VTGQRDGFTKEHTVSLPVEPVKQRRKRQRCRDARSTDYLVRAANATRVRNASKSKSADEKWRLRKAHNASQQKSYTAGYFDGLLDTTSDEDTPRVTSMDSLTLLVTKMTQRRQS